MKAECHMSAVAEVDFTPIPQVILFNPRSFSTGSTKAVGVLPHRRYEIFST